MSSHRSSKLVPYVVICEALPTEAIAVVHARCAADAVRDFLSARPGLTPETRVSAYRHDASFRWKPEFHLDGIPSEESVGHAGGATMATEEDREAAVAAASERLNSAIRRYVIASGGTPQRHNDSSLPLHLRRESKDALHELTAALSEMKDLARGE